MLIFPTAFGDSLNSLSSPSKLMTILLLIVGGLLLYVAIKTAVSAGMKDYYEPDTNRLPVFHPRRIEERDRRAAMHNAQVERNLAELRARRAKSENQ